MRVLVVFTTAFVPYGGLTTVMMNYWRAMDKSDLQIDFASTNAPSQILIDEISAKGSCYHQLPPRKHILAYLKELFFLSKRYDVLHVHGNSATSVLELGAAKFAGVKQRIIHNHNSVTNHPILNKILLPFFKRSYTEALACSNLAGQWLFGKNNFSVVRNAIDLQKYFFSQDSREKKRTELGFLQNDFVVGHVGKFNKQKNYPFIVEVFAELHKINPHSKLLLVGGGDLENSIRIKVDKMGLAESVVFAGLRTDTAEIMNAMDVFLFPSLWEGLPLSALEAQASGLPVYLSNVISEEVCISDNLKSLSLEESADSWAKCILSTSDTSHRYDNSLKNQKKLAKWGYNIYFEADSLRNLYFKRMD